jgi:hypothetical protein
MIEDLMKVIRDFDIKYIIKETKITLMIKFKHKLEVIYWNLSSLKIDFNEVKSF